MNSPNAHNRDEFLEALEEARRAALGSMDDQNDEPLRPETSHPASFEFRRVIDDLAGKVRSYVSAHILSRLYAETASQPEANRRAEPSPPPSPPPLPSKSVHDTVLDELHLTPNLSADDLVKLRREYAKTHHPDLVMPDSREEATRRMTIANVLIDEALRTRKSQAH